MAPNLLSYIARSQKLVLPHLWAGPTRPSPRKLPWDETGDGLAGREHQPLCSRGAASLQGPESILSGQKRRSDLLGPPWTVGQVLKKLDLLTIIANAKRPVDEFEQLGPARDSLKRLVAEAGRAQHGGRFGFYCRFTHPTKL